MTHQISRRHLAKLAGLHVLARLLRRLDGTAVERAEHRDKAQTALVVTGEPPAGSDTAGGNRGALVARFAAAVDARGAGAVLAGRPGAAAGNGPVAVVRADAALSSGLSTVDNLDREAGRITTILAVREQLDGGAGRYGTGPGASGVTVGSAAR